jgi:hypothetical protein
MNLNFKNKPMKNFTNAKDAYNPNLEVFRTDETVRILKEEKSAVILRNVAIFDLTNSEKEILKSNPDIDDDYINYKRISVMPHFEKEINSLENTFFKKNDEKFNPNKLIHFFYARSGSEVAVEKTIDNDGNNLTLVNLCFHKDIGIYKLNYDDNQPLVSSSSILALDGDIDNDGNLTRPIGGNGEYTTESIAKKGIYKKYV